MPDFKLKLMCQTPLTDGTVQQARYCSSPFRLPRRPAPEHRVADFLEFIVDRVHELVDVLPARTTAHFQDLRRIS